jgi:flagellar motor switch protein FliG
MAEDIFQKKLTGPEKAAILLLAVDAENSSKIFAMMTEEEVKEVSGAMAKLGVIRPDVVEHLVHEFTTELSNLTPFVGNIDTTEKLLEKALGKEKIKNLLDEIRGPVGKNTWDKLGNVNEDILASYLKNEYPQTAALIISKLASNHAARVLSSLPEDFTTEVLLRMINMEPVKKEVLDRVEKILKAEFISTLTKTQKHNTNVIIAEIFNNFDRNNETRYMKILENKVPESAATIKDLMFTFDDLIKVNGAGIQAMMRNIDKSKLTIALKGASEQIRTLFTSNMSQRAAKILQEDIEALGPVKVKDVDQAQGAIVAIAREMAMNGEITIAGGGDEELIN